jgi:hypothetical protein
MTITLQREKSDDRRTFGRLSVDGMFECHTLEDPVRTKKIPGVTAIPAGRYEIVVTESPRFKRRLPLLLSVPGFDGVRIHPGTKETDTEGCILTGLGRTSTIITGSRIAFSNLFVKITSALERKERVWIIINSSEGIKES